MDEPTDRARVYFESLDTPELQRKIVFYRGEAKTQEALLEDGQRRVQAVWAEIATMQQVVTARYETDNHLPIYSPKQQS